MQGSFEIKTLDALNGYTLEWIDEDGYLLSKGNELFESRDLIPPFTSIDVFPSAAFQGVLSKIRPFQRLFRFLYYNVIKLTPNRIFVTFQKDVGLIEDGRFVPVEGLLRPCRFLRGACAVDTRGGVYLGEYLSNPERGPMRLYYLEPGSSQLEVIHELPRGSIRHIHGLYHDPFGQKVWMVSGDRDHECRVLRSDDRFHTMETVGEGDETWRTVSLVFREDAVYYGMDAEFQQNYLYKIDRKTLQRTRLGEVDGPVYYSVEIGDYLFFGVTAEGCPSQQENRASLWVVDREDKVTRVASWAKDPYPGILMPGTLHFPLGPGRKDRLFFYCLGLAGADHTTKLLTVHSTSKRERSGV